MAKTRPMGRAAAATSTRRATRPATRRSRPPVRRRAGSGVRWDRIQRVALLLVLGGVLMLYVGPARSYFETWRESGKRTAQLHRAQAENHRLLARRRGLRDPRSLEREARALGMVKPGERAFVIQDAPRPKN